MKGLQNGYEWECRRIELMGGNKANEGEAVMSDRGRRSKGRKCRQVRISPFPRISHGGGEAVRGCLTAPEGP